MAGVDPFYGPAFGIEKTGILDCILCIWLMLFRKPEGEIKPFLGMNR
jgi:hypothetical protein